MKPKVAVCMIAYNQERWIAGAIESVLKQKTNFPFWLVIGEDCSTDETREIIKGYASRFPHIIQPLFHEHNVGIYENYQRTFAKCREAEFVATLDPDDFYCDENKLQSHVDVLTKRPELVGSFSNTVIEYVDEPKRKPFYIMPPERKRQIFGIKDLLASGNFIANCSIVYRGGAFSGIPSWYPKERRCLDWATHIDVASHGNIYYFPKVMCVYRFLATSDWSGRGEIGRLTESIKALEVIQQHYEGLFDEVIEPRLAAWRTQCRKLSKHTG